MNVSHCRQSQRRRFVSLNTTINIDFNHITLSRAPLMLCRFFFRSFLFWPPMLAPPIFAPHLTFFFSRFDLFGWSCQCHQNSCLPERKKTYSIYAAFAASSSERPIRLTSFTLKKRQWVSRTLAAAILIVVQGYGVPSLSPSQSILLMHTRDREKNV